MKQSAKRTRNSIIIGLLLSVLLMNNFYPIILESQAQARMQTKKDIERYRGDNYYLESTEVLDYDTQESKSLVQASGETISETVIENDYTESYNPEVIDVEDLEKKLRWAMDYIDDEGTLRTLFPNKEAYDQFLEDAEFLAIVVECEEGNMSIIAKFLCACVVINRTKDSDFGYTTLREIVYSRKYVKQYACAWNGMIEKRKASDESLSIAMVALIFSSEYVPDDLVYQSEFKQGSREYYTEGNQHFCIK